MSLNNATLKSPNKMLEWVTIQEAATIASQIIDKNLTVSDLYRHALCGNIHLSIYFQSPIILRKVQKNNNKIKLCLATDSFLTKLCLLDGINFTNGINLIISTSGKHFSPRQRVIDTTLIGYEYVIVQSLLAQSLNIPLPITGANSINYGLSVSISGEIFQLFEKTTWATRMEKQIKRLPDSIKLNSYEYFLPQKAESHGYFPIYNLPKDACLVIRHSELEKLIKIYIRNKNVSSSSTRISTPLSRMFWLACKHNEAISPLIRHPYKLLSIFEQWASDDGITDRLSGDTLKNALERGSPSSASLPL
ncbi:TPA: hypothetical protein L2B26_002676 [Klebsiella oxytoca]|uniref:Uncharacterized protein n=1 Tax=Citrobacter telavivensis TaxID=2653932 RepID=A0A6L5E9E5_9ENTR|nr:MULTISPECIES: hypothetical protein [Enterobacteriaceae]HBN2791758.1 hypothetical protein [Klebsiella oxytoca]EFL6477731.1 hypothetical protein [Escherichia coli]EKD2605801.1 hypothetical protein [Escherichia coli]KUH05820.1 hypothetical protein ARC82_04400 [Escherichia coli]MDM3084380.1 hypothetical protein [Citrobacter sp. Cf141]